MLYSTFNLNKGVVMKELIILPLNSEWTHPAQQIAFAETFLSWMVEYD